MRVQTDADGAATTDARANAATSEARAATEASHGIKAAKEIEVETAVNRAWTKRISTNPDRRRARLG